MPSWPAADWASTGCLSHGRPGEPEPSFLSVSVCLLSISIFNLSVLFHRPVFKDASGALDKSARFSPLYRQDGNKLSEEDLFKLLADFRKLVFSSYHHRGVNLLF